jgi:A/G-specific adenine glycosylase
MNEIEKLHLWFEENKREFPWREERTPYRVWVSEVMLQQTRASVVIPYFIRWMKLFPDIKSLAQASLSTVIKSWEGLGYYSRARRLHEGAKDIYHRFKGTLPSCPDQLRSIKGLGPYTIGAILNFGFHKKAPAIDGNVIRVLSRYFSIEENVGRASTKRLLEQKVNIWLENSAPWVTSEALIELGATICLPKPQCSICPIHSDCLGFSSGKASMLPIKTSSPEIIDLYRMVAVIESDGFFLVKKAEPGKVMADLYEFPYFEIKKGDRIAQLIIQKTFAVEWEETDKLSSSKRGKGGFGHTGLD